jgi:hypothetical protein
MGFNHQKMSRRQGFVFLALLIVFNPIDRKPLRVSCPVGNKFNLRFTFTDCLPQTFLLRAAK